MKYILIIFGILFSPFSCFSQLFAPHSGMYSESGIDDVNKNIPLTTFDRENDIETWKKIIINKILNKEDNYHKIYEAIYTNALNSLNSGCNGNICNYACMAKDAAFIYFLGVGKLNNLNDFDTLTEFTNPQRSFFYNQSVSILKAWWTKGEGGYGGKENQVYRAKENILLLQAYDFLECAKKTGQSFNESDRNQVRYQLFNTTYELYSRANNILSLTINPHADVGGALTIDNNMALVVAAAVGMGAIVLHDRPVYFWQTQMKPSRWASAANAYINHVLWNSNSPLSVKNAPNGGGFAEGPHYYRFAFEALWPYFQSFKNFTGGKRTKFGPYKKHLLSVYEEYMFNYYCNPDILKLNDWYLNIQLPNGFAPSIDDSWIDARYIGTALSGQPSHSTIYNPVVGLSDKFDIKEDFMAKQNIGKVPDFLVGTYTNKEAGNLIVRFKSGTGMANRHYLHLNVENGVSLNGGRNHKVEGFKISNFTIWNSFSWGHEHGDVSSIILFSGISDYLALDPALFGTENLDNFKINQGEHHNVITVDGQGPDEEDGAIYSNLTDLKDLVLLNCKVNYWNRFLGIKTDRKAVVNRNITVHEDDLYYTVIDQVQNKDLIFGNRDISFHFSGNGSENNLNSFKKKGNIAIWDYPCIKEENSSVNNSDNWKIRLVTTAIVDDALLNIDFTSENQNYHGNFNSISYDNNSNDFKLLDGLGQINSIQHSKYGKHNSVDLTKNIGFNDEIRFLSTIELFRCSDTTTFSNLPFVKYSPNYTCHVVKRESKKDIHLTRSYKRNEADTIIDPMDFSSSAILEIDANNIFLSYDTKPEYKSGNCISYCNFRKASITNGRLLKYNDTTYLSATKYSTSYYGLIGKCKYKAYIETDTACSVSFYLADVEKGIGMKVKDLTYTYDTNTCIITVSVPVGFTQFEIELEDPCRVSCFFPSTAETIHETFDFNQGVTATLGHKLDIVQPNGFLNISNGSHMMLCDGIYLRNKDSLILNSNCGKDTGQLTVTSCDGRVNGTPYGSIGGMGGGAKPSKITVNTGAALILDTNSFTQISNNSELHVWGSLVIKNGAKLLIGDERTCSYATIMVYPGAYLHIEDSANLEFFKIVGDTQDRHVFFIANKPIGAAVQKGVKPSIINLLQNDTILNSSNIPVDICALNTVTPTYGIANRDWGFCNVLAPLARIKLPSDTICLGECAQIDFESSLNDPIRELEVCRIDTLLGAAYTSCFGTKQLLGGSLDIGYNEGTTCYSTEPHIKVFPLCSFIDSANHWYKIHVTVKNHCNLQDTQTLYFFVGRKPNAIISVSDSACGGYGTVTAINLSNLNAEKAIWHVHIIDTTQYQENDENRGYYGGDWEVYAPHYADTFRFPDLNWIGGFKYAVNLTQMGHCGESISYWDTVEIQPGAKIMASPATIYSDPLGPSALQLKAFIGNATSFSWSPTSYLDTATSLTPIATPSDTITYILSAFKNSCAAYDTLSIKLNTMAFAGYTDTVCNEPVLLGTNFDASLFLAYQYYENPSEVWSILSPFLANDSAFFDKVSMYFLSSFGKNALQSLPPYANFLGSFNRNQFYSQNWYLNYFKAYHTQHKYQDAFDIFTRNVGSNSTLSSYIAANPMYTMASLQTFLDLYQNELYMGNAVQMQTTWEKYTQNGSTWESLGQWENQIKIWDTVAVPTTYKITVIDNVNGKVEFDQVDIWSDQALTPAFYVQFQTDSTLYFSNVTEPVQATTTYFWNFGDGTTSNQINPVHTFPYFDSSYVVCLTATNLCGTVSYCDTLRVDSTGLGMYSKIHNPTPPISNTTQTGFKAEGITLIAFPNPFSSEVNIAYQINQEYAQASLILTDYLGKELQTYTLPNDKGLLALPMQDLSAGLYTYQLILDGRLVQTGKLVKE